MDAVKRTGKTFYWAKSRGVKNSGKIITFMEKLISELADRDDPCPAGSGSWNGSFCMWCSNAGNRAEPAGRSVCTWYTGWL